MTNLEWLLENDKESLVELLATRESWGINKITNALVKNCRHVPCNSCMFCDKPNSCIVERENWLNSEHEEPLLFPIGTIVEVSDSDNTKHTGYYNGFENGKHYVSHYRHFLGCRYHDGELYGGKYDANQIRKVGDSNA